MKMDKQKDSKNNKQKMDLTKSLQSLSYMLSPLDQECQKTLSGLSRAYDIDKIEAIYQIEIDTQYNRPFLKTPHNLYKAKDTGVTSYRSPYSNKYYPPVQNGVHPSPVVRLIEQKGRLLFEEYAKMYYGDCISNFFVEENEDEFCFAFCVQNRINEDGCVGIWSSMNVANISGDPTKSIAYKVNSSVIYEITSTEDTDSSKPFSISGNLKKSKNETKKLTPDMQIEDLHLTVIGKIIEENEISLRQQMQCIFARKTKEIICKTRIAETKQILEERKSLAKQLLQPIKKEGVVEM